MVKVLGIVWFCNWKVLCLPPQGQPTCASAKVAIAQDIVYRILFAAPCCVNNPSSQTTQLHKRQVERTYSNIVSRPMAVRMPSHLRWPALVVCDVTLLSAISLFILTQTRPKDAFIEQ